MAKKRKTGMQVAKKKAAKAQRPPRPKKGKTVGQRMAIKEKTLLDYADHIKNLEKRLKETKDPDLRKNIIKIINQYHDMSDKLFI